jgi:hypothetical protein
MRIDLDNNKKDAPHPQAASHLVLGSSVPHSAMYISEERSVGLKMWIIKKLEYM